MKSNAEVTKKDIVNAFARYDEGVRPKKGDGSGTPKDKWVYDPKNDKFYPAKTIWVMAAKPKVGTWHYNELKKGFQALGYEVCEMKLHDTDDLKKTVYESPGASKKREERLKKAPKKPRKGYRLTTFFDRNLDVIAEVLYRAKGKCGCCGGEPFKREDDGSTYLEVHHIKRLAEGGDDTIENAIALCPNCHREQHFGDLKKKPRLPVRKKLARR